MSEEQEIKEKIEDLGYLLMEIQGQINSLEKDIMIIEKPKILESDLEIMVQDIAQMMSNILVDTSQNIWEHKGLRGRRKFYKDIKKYLEERFHTVVPDQTQNIN